MSSNNQIAIISDSDFAVQEITNMLVLLRDVDKVECYDYFDAEDAIKNKVPNVIILHSNENDKNSLKLIKKIKDYKETKNTPIILYPEQATSDYIVEAFDLGVSDILSYPLKDYELIIRTIWAIQKNEAFYMDEVKNSFLSKLDIIDEETGFCKEEFCLQYIEAVIKKAKENNQNSCLMLIKTYPALNLKEDRKTFTKTLSSAIRKNDVIAVKEPDTYYILLSKAKLSGVYSVYERIMSKLGPLAATSASVVEIKDELFENIISVLDYTLNKAPKNGELVVVGEQDFIDLYSSESELGISDILEDESEDKSDDKMIEELNDEIVVEKDDDKLDLGIKIMQEKINNIDYEKEAALRRQKSEQKLDETNADKRSAILYKQSWAKKLNLVVEPLFKKYAAKFQEEFSTLVADISVEPFNCFMNFDKDEIKYNIKIEYDEIKTLKFTINVYAIETELESDSFDIEVMDFDFEKFNIILKTSLDEYKNYLQTS